MVVAPRIGQDEVADRFTHRRSLQLRPAQYSR